MMSSNREIMQTVLACIAVCWLMTAWAAAGPVPSKSDLLPTLQRQPLASKSAAYYLAAGEDWRPGGVPQISVLMAEEPLVFHIESTGSQAGLQSVRLLFKCSSGDSEFKEALLETGVQSSTHCRPLRPFKLERLSASLYRLTLLRENQVPFEQALRHSLELRLRLSFYQGVLESASLFIFNFDAVSNFKSASGAKPCATDCSDVPGSEFLNDTGVKYLQTADEYLLDRPIFFYSKIQLFRPEFINAIKLAEPMVRNLLTFTLFYSENCSSFSSPLVFATAGVGSSISSSSRMPFYGRFLDMETGVLHLTPTGTRYIFDKLGNHSGEIDICLNISVKSDAWPYYQTYRIQRTNATTMKSNMVSSTVFNLTFSYRDSCFNHTGRYNTIVQLPASISNLSLMCPMLCSVEAKYIVDFDGSHCSRTGSDDVSGRPTCSRFFSASSDSCEIDLIGPTSQMHSGNYTIIAGGMKHTYHVSVVSLPLFTSDSLSAETRDFNPESAPATLGCAVTYCGIRPVDIVPQFRLLERFKPGLNWTRVSLHVFNNMVLNGDPQSVVLSTDQTDTRSELSIRVTDRQKEFWWVSWTATFECSASVTQYEARLFGLPEYRVRATWNLAYDSESKQRSPASVAEPCPVQSLRVVLISASAVFTAKTLLC